MGFLSSRNYSGGLKTTMSPGSGGGGRGGYDLNVGDLFGAMRRRGKPKGYVTHTEGGATGRDAQADWRQSQLDQQLAAETEALTRPGPLKTVTVGQQSFHTSDPNAMTGAQRQAFLPGNSTMQPDARDAYRAMLEAKDEEELYSDEGRRRRRAEGVGAGGL